MSKIYLKGISKQILDHFQVISFYKLSYTRTLVRNNLLHFKGKLHREYNFLTNIKIDINLVSLPIHRKLGGDVYAFFTKKQSNAKKNLYYK